MWLNVILNGMEPLLNQYTKKNILYKKITSIQGWAEWIFNIFISQCWCAISSPFKVLTQCMTLTCLYNQLCPSNLIIRRVNHFHKYIFCEKLPIKFCTVLKLYYGHHLSENLDYAWYIDGRSICYAKVSCYSHAIVPGSVFFHSNPKPKKCS